MERSPALQPSSDRAKAIRLSQDESKQMSPTCDTKCFGARMGKTLVIGHPFSVDADRCDECLQTIIQGFDTYQSRTEFAESW